ncbi:MAG: sugar ABC transporter permease, partial [Treponema sp.]|nr:sugar ABC transporter permease [Treponema sp.]
MSRQIQKLIQRQGRLIRKDHTEFYMLIPALIALAVISFFPLIYTIYLTFFNFTIAIDEPSFVGFSNWIKIFRNPTFWFSWGRTAIFASSALFLELLFGVTNALIVYHLPKGGHLILTLLMLPIFVAPIVAGLLGRFMLNSTYGMYAWVLSHLGYTKEIFGRPVASMVALILIDVWEWTPLIFLIVFAGLQSLDMETLEAAAVDGANVFQKLVHIILPLIFRTILVSLLVRAMDILRYVDTINIITQGGPADATK